MTRADDWTPLLNSIVGAVGGGGIVGALAWLREKEKGKTAAQRAQFGAPSAMVGEAAEFQKFLNEHSERYMSSLRQDIGRLDGKIQRLEEENLECRNEANQLRQHIESLEAFLRSQNIPVPQRRLERSFTVLENGHVTTMHATPSEDTP